MHSHNKSIQLFNVYKVAFRKGKRCGDTAVDVFRFDSRVRKVKLKMSSWVMSHEHDVWVPVMPSNLVQRNCSLTLYSNHPHGWEAQICTLWYKSRVLINLVTGYCAPQLVKFLSFLLCFCFSLEKPWLPGLSKIPYVPQLFINLQLLCATWLHRQLVPTRCADPWMASPK